jgi:glyoxylase-like metal-dependent hydrolase (beta-lactamase superfamily II)
MTRIWEIYALRYAVLDRPAGENFINPRDDHLSSMPLDYYVWLLRSGTSDIVVDVGFNEASGAKRGRSLLRTVDTALKELNVDLTSVRDVIITHLHYDHAGNLDLFPRARFHIQDSEMSFVTGRHMGSSAMRHPFEVDDVIAMVRAVYGERVLFHNGTEEIAPGITVHRVGGHTDGLQVVTVETARGTVVLASDASHFYANMREQNPFPIVFNLGDMVEGWRLLHKLVDGNEDMIIPGHDPLVRERYPSVEGTNDECVALHVAPKPEKN